MADRQEPHPAVDTRLKRAAAAARAATAERDRLIVEAFRGEAGLREIAIAVNMSHPGVRSIVRKHTQPEDDERRDRST